MPEAWGQVRRYDSEKGYGFISGDDGTDYFFHITNVTDGAYISRGNRVTFEPGTSEKGPRAHRIIIREMPSRPDRGKPAQPDRFIMTREPEARGYKVIKVIAECWGEAFDPNKAKDALKEQAISAGANAVVGLELEKYSKSPYPIWARLLGVGTNYYQTMHRFHGTAVVVRRL
jgi:CspA family cold shock protein